MKFGFHFYSFSVTNVWGFLQWKGFHCFMAEKMFYKPEACRFMVCVLLLVFNISWNGSFAECRLTSVYVESINNLLVTWTGIIKTSAFSYLFYCNTGLNILGKFSCMLTNSKCFFVLCFIWDAPVIEFVIWLPSFLLFYESKLGVELRTQNTELNPLPFENEVT